MDMYHLLGNRFDCECGKTHDVGVRHFVYQAGICEKVGEIIRRSLPECRTIRVVADNRTWQVCGQDVFDRLKGNFQTNAIIVPDPNSHSPVCDDLTCQWLKNELSPNMPDLVIAVGSGVINDLCKWSSFELDLPYMVMATAASMNGYAAANIAGKVEGLKVVIKGRPPLAVLAEPRVIEQAPYEMTAAGFGDTIAKAFSHADWMMNHRLLSEYYCPFCNRMLGVIEPLYLVHPKDLKTRQPESVKGLFEALFWTGIAMTMVGTSTPASGGEHLLSHTLDMKSSIEGIDHDLHGRQVGVGTLISAVLFDEALKIDTPQFHDIPESVDVDYWRDAKTIKSIKNQYAQKKQTLVQLTEKLKTQSQWDDLRNTLRPLIKTPQQVKDLLIAAGAGRRIDDLCYTPDQFKEAVLHMHEIRSRPTVVDLAWLTGILPNSIDEIINQWLKD